jgi:two-component sensor histidine kinase
MPEDAIAPRTLDRLLLDEANHRVANEVAAALAAMRIAQSARYRGSRIRMIDAAIDRLEGFGQCARLFAGVPSGFTDVGVLVEDVSRAMLRSRMDGRPTHMVLDVKSIVVDGETARRVAMIAYELINNALKHAFDSGGGLLEVRLEPLAGGIVLSVIDDGPGLEPGHALASGEEGLGGRIVSDLVRLSGGHLACTTGPNGTAVRVMLPSMIRP